MAARPAKGFVEHPIVAGSYPSVRGIIGIGAVFGTEPVLAQKLDEARAEFIEDFWADRVEEIAQSRG